MQSKALTVDDYMKEVPEARPEALTRLRDLCRKILVGYEEAMGYGMPGYSKDGVSEIGFNSQKHFIAFYCTKIGVLDRYRDQLPDCGKSCIRYSKPEKIDFDLLERLLKDNVGSDEKPC